jgi:hypothetical protein
MELAAEIRKSYRRLHVGITGVLTIKVIGPFRVCLLARNVEDYNLG